MFIKVNFVDNDFCNEVVRACEDILSEGYDDRIENSIKKHGIENLRKGIVIAAYGNYIALQGYRWLSLFNRSADFDTISKIYEYLNDCISIQIVEHIDSGNYNHEICYIDTYENKVHLF